MKEADDVKSFHWRGRWGRRATDSAGRFGLALICLAVSLAASMLSTARPVVAETAGPIVREEATVVVDGVEEHWRLEWLRPTVPMCSPEDDDWWICPCMGFAFGEEGDLQLVRERPGQEQERLHLTPLFGFSYDQTGNDPHAILRRWDVDWDVDGRDLEEKPSAAFAARVRARPLARIMNFADYDNDGRATEFMLQIGTEPCGKKESIVVGISRDNPHLHAFASVRNPGKPLLLMDWQWNALNGSKDVVEVGDLTCGDHGSDVNRDLVLRAENGRISATRRTYECTGQATRGGLSKEEDF